MSNFKDDFEGTGSLKPLVDEMNRIAKALNNLQVNMPRNYGGMPAVSKIDGDRLIIDMQDVSFKDESQIG